MTNRVLTVKKISFSANYLSSLKNLLDDYQQREYLQGVPVKQLKLAPKEYSESGYLVFLVNKNMRPSILKIIWDNQFYFRYKAEIFIYENLAKQKTIAAYLPKLLCKKVKPIPFFEIEYLVAYQPLGDKHQIKIQLTSYLVNKIIDVLSRFHRLKVERKDFLNQQRTAFFYKEKLTRLATGKRVVRYFGSEIKNKLINFLKKNESMFSGENRFILGDRNPSNIFILPQKNSLKLIDFDRIGFANPALDYTYLYLSSIEQPDALSLFLSRLKQVYGNNQIFWTRYWYDLLIRCADEMAFWDEKDQSRLRLLKSIFEQTLLKLNQ